MIYPPTFGITSTAPSGLSSYSQLTATLQVSGGSQITGYLIVGTSSSNISQSPDAYSLEIYPYLLFVATSVLPSLTGPTTGVIRVQGTGRTDGVKLTGNISGSQFSTTVIASQSTWNA